MGRSARTSDGSGLSTPGRLANGVFRLSALLRVPKVRIEWVRTTRQNLPISHHHTQRSCDDMCFGQAVSIFRRAKNKPSTSGDRPGGRRAIARDEGFNRPTLSIQSVPPIEWAGELGGDVRTGVGNDDLELGDLRPVSRSLVGRSSGQRRSDDYGDRQERGQRGPHPEAYIQARGEPSRGRRNVSDTRKIPTSSISRGSESA